MPRCLLVVSLVALGGTLGLAVAAQQPVATAPPTTPTTSGLQQTPPIAPKTQETPVPPPVTIPPAPLPAGVTNRPLTADEAARIALRRQPNIDVARANFLAQQGLTQQLRSGLLPTFNVTAGYNNVTTLSGQSSSTSSSTTAGGTTGGATGGTTGGTSGGATTGSSVGIGSSALLGLSGTPTDTSGSSVSSTGPAGGATTSALNTGAALTQVTPGTTTGGASLTQVSPNQSAGSGSTTGSGGGSTGGTSGGSGTTGGGSTVTGFGPTSSASGTGWTASATIRQLIFDFNHTRDLVQQSVQLERAANHNLTRVQHDVVFQVKQAFYQYLEDTRLVTANEENLANSQSQIALARARLNSGLGLPSDVVTAETAVSQAVLNLNVARNNASLARVNLAYLMGIDPRTPITIADMAEPPFPSDDVNGMVNTGLRQRPEMLQALATIQADRYGINAAKTTNTPVLSGNLGVSTRGADFPPDNSSLTVGASVSFDPFDGGLTAGRVKTARANLTAAQAQLTNTELAVTGEISQAYFNLRIAEQRVGIADIEVTNATEGVRIAEGRYRSGLGLFLDIINAQSQLLTARTNRVLAQYAVDQARAAIARAIGNPVPAP